MDDHGLVEGSIVSDETYVIDMYWTGYCDGPQVFGVTESIPEANTGQRWSI